MKKSKIALILSASTMMTLVLAACNGRGAVSSSITASSSETPVSSSASATVTKVTANDVPLVKVDTDLDLDTIVVVTKSDGTTTSKDYTVSCSDKVVTLTGHVFKATAPGDFVVVVVAGGKTIKVTVTVKTETGLALIPFFKQLDNNPLNYTEKLVAYNETTKAFDYDGFTFIHNPKYFLGYNEKDPGSLTSKGEANSEVLATLSDGKSYWGALDTTGKPVFDAGAVDFALYYITQDLAIDGSAFASTLDATTGAETISAPASVTSGILESGFGYSADALSSYGYTASTTDILAVNKGTDGTISDVTLSLNVVDSKGAVSAWEIYTLSNIGTTQVDFMETAIADASYVPAAITAPEVTTEFAAVTTAKNYTTTISVYAADENGDAIPTATVAATPANYNFTQMFGTDGLGYKQTTTITSDGLFAKEETLNVGATAAETTATLANEVAYFNRDSKSYKVAYDKTKKTATTTLIDGTTDVWTVAAAKGFTAEGVTEAGVNATEWTKKATSGTTTTLEGKVGDNDGTTAGNVLFQQMFDQLRFLGWGSTNPESMGTYLTEANEFTSGDKHADTIYSDWMSLAVDSAAHSITAKALVYLPFGKVSGSAYMVCEYSVSAVGTTTNDFSAFTVA
jgi:hypothetical protein